MNAAMCKTDFYYSFVYTWNNFCILQFRHFNVLKTRLNYHAYHDSVRLLVQPSRNGMQGDLHLAVSDA